MPHPPKDLQIAPARVVARNEETAWKQVLTRDPAADGAFVYAVESTAIYCRPTCPSRRPRRSNVRFFPAAAAAEKAGYRACLRCHPAAGQTRSDEEAALVSRLCGHLEEHLDRVVTLPELGTLAGSSGFTVQRLFRRVLGVSPRQFQLQLRAAGFRDLITSKTNADKPPTVTGALYQAGYNAGSRFYTRAREKIGMTPTRFRNGGWQETIQFVTAPCPLGILLVASTTVGICWVALGDTPEELEAVLRDHFRHATVVSAGTSNALLHLGLQKALSQLTEHPLSTALPLDLRATVFQQRVWQALVRIPRGETRTYGQLAAELKQPTASRAIARACATNPVALLVPCHRVIRASGDLSGYRWGKQRKQAILHLESEDH